MQLRILGSAAVLLALAAPKASAEIIYLFQEISTIRQLVSFDSATPGTTTAVSLSGFPGTDTTLFGIDFRPSDGLLYGRSTAGGLDGSTVRIDTTTGVMTAIGVPTANGGGVFYGIDFNPVVDLYRLVSDANNNRRFNPDTGALVGPDTDLNPSSAVSHLAYANNVAGASTTTLFGIDHTTNMLVMIGGVDGVPSPNGGLVSVVGGLGLDANNFGGFDISGATGIAYSVFRVSNLTGLYTINLTTGAATLVGTIGDGSGFFNGLSVQPSNEIPEPSSLALMGLGLGGLLIGALRRRG